MIGWHVARNWGAGDVGGAAAYSMRKRIKMASTFKRLISNLAIVFLFLELES